jgi:hypothetical protein
VVVREDVAVGAHDDARAEAALAVGPDVGSAEAAREEEREGIIAAV